MLCIVQWQSFQTGTVDDLLISDDDEKTLTELATHDF